MPDKSGTPVSAAAKDGSDIKVKIVVPDPAYPDPETEPKFEALSTLNRPKNYQQPNRWFSERYVDLHF